MNRPPRRLARTTALAVAGSLAVAGCGSSKIAGTAGTAPNASRPMNAQSADQALVALVPAALRARGTVRIATDPTYAPNAFKDPNGDIIGMEVDLGNAIFTRLGLKPQWQSADFGIIIGGLDAKKYDLGLASFTDTREREKQLDMVGYFNAGEAIATLAGNPYKLTGNAEDLCGIRVAVQTNTIEATEIAETINPACTKAGKPEIPDNGDRFNAQTDAVSALVAKRAQAMMADSPVVDYVVQQSNGRLMKIGSAYNTAPYGIAIPKGDGRLAEAVQGALKGLINDGTYVQILTKWGVQSGALTADQVLINAATG
ncbi:ABC transporter substrate-binding protein [Kitasatospora sp. NPDC059327]|uniref:ABC transporter substrate-binding protein n=1 Tax=Kitasatospora sp. NPDC059327 TaxID=3346803 RepID=UPI0036BE3678